MAAPRYKETRLHRRNDGSPALHFQQFRAMLRDYLPEALRRTDNDTRPARNKWVTVKVRPEVFHTMSIMVERHRATTGSHLTQSEVLTAAFNLALPVLVTRLFPSEAGEA